MLPFRASRRRHGRAARGSLSSHLGVKAPLGFFETVVSQSVEFLKLSWPEELEHLRWRVLDSPMFPEGIFEVPRYSVNPSEFRITIYRIPIERLTHHRRTDRLDERFHIEQYVFQAVADLLGKDPGDIIPDRYKR
jgi:hypothetical protein